MKDSSSFPHPPLKLRVIALALLALGFVASVRAQAQNSSELTATYGRGVHAYFANRTDLAEQFFSQVIEAGSTDPRVFYFRAMTRVRSGRPYEAEEDMRMGATLEARDPGNRLAIGKALERVQGPHRILLEGFRQQARLERLEQRQRQTRDRYEQLRLREPDVLRREMPVPLEDLVEPSLELTEGAGETSTSEAAAPTGVTSDPAPARPVPPQESADDDPFGTAAPAEDDIFSEPPQPAAESESPEVPTESPAPAEGDPFSEPKPAEEPVDEDDPFAVAPPSSTDSGGESADVVETAPSSAGAELTQDDRIDSGQMLGVLGRVAASVFPWRGLELPALGPTSGPGEFDSDFEPAGIELGPVAEDSAVLRASAEQPIEAKDESADLFGESAIDSSEQPADDPFSGSADEPTDDLFGGEASDEAPAAPPEAGEEENSESEKPAADFDDPFGNF
jgi:hypothetical protein